MTSWTRDPDPDSEPKPSLQLTRRGEIVAMAVLLFVLVGLMALVGRIEGVS